MVSFLPGSEGSFSGSLDAQGLPENFAPLLVENIKEGAFTHVFAGHSAFGKNLMPRVAALLDSQQISDITAIESEDSMLSLRALPWCDGLPGCDGLLA